MLAGLTRSTVVARLSHYDGEVNAIHPFREGNGRAQRAFLARLSREPGWRIAWSELDGAENDAASAAALQGDVKPVIAMFEGIVRAL